MAITINQFKGIRSYGDGVISYRGEYLKVYIQFTSTASASYRLEYKLDSVETWTQLLSGTGTSYNGEWLSSTAILDTDYSYNIRLVINDGGDEDEVATDYIATGFVLVDFNVSGLGLAIGKVSSNDNSFEIGMDAIDKFGTLIGNGLAFYEEGASTDVDTCIEPLFISNITDIGGMYFVKQFFYADKSATSNRMQIAYPYAYNSISMVGHDKSIFRRNYVYNLGWSQWVEENSIVDSGIEDFWTWKKYSDGTAECFGKINISQVAVTAAMGGWYRSEVLYSESDYPYPVTFNGQPCTEMMYQTRSGSGALVWPFSSSATNAQTYLPQCYLIRPTSANSTNGNINIIVKGLTS